jgi:hypothetical protein
VTLADARRLALSLPETAERPHFAMTSFRVRDRIFATAPPDGSRLHVFVDEGEVRAAVAEDPGRFQELRWGRRLAGLRIDLPAAEPQRVYELLVEAWRRRAPRRLVAAFDADPARRVMPR